MTVLARYLVARQAIRYGVLWQIFSNGLNILVVALAVWWWGPLGYPVGLCLHLLAYMLIITGSIMRRFPGIPIGAVWRSYGVTAAACGLAALPVVGFRVWVGATLGPWALGLASVLLFCGVYGAALAVWPADRMARDYCWNLGGPVLKRFAGLRIIRPRVSDNKEG